MESQAGFWTWLTCRQTTRLFTLVSLLVFAYSLHQVKILGGWMRVGLAGDLCWWRFCYGIHQGVSKNRGFSPQIIHFLIGFSIINHPFWGTGTTIFGNWNIHQNKNSEGIPQGPGDLCFFEVASDWFNSSNIATLIVAKGPHQLTQSTLWGKSPLAIKSP